MTDSEHFQAKARFFATRTAHHLREAADALDAAYKGAPVTSDSMLALEKVNAGIRDALTCMAHATHQHALAVLHKERERGQEGK